MIDMTNPSPLLMTAFERTAFIGAVIGVVVTLALDFWRARSKR
jgi:hypothetical protein